jgi:hypothetical protein
MNLVDLFGIGTFTLITILFFLVGSRPVFFHIACAIFILIFVRQTGKHLDPEGASKWAVLTAGLTLYWFGLVIVRIMLTRSVSLHMLAAYAKGEVKQNMSEGIAGRLKDAAHFGLIRGNESSYHLTFFGQFIATIVAITYFILRIK